MRCTRTASLRFGTPAAHCVGVFHWLHLSEVLLHDHMLWLRTQVNVVAEWVCRSSEWCRSQFRRSDRLSGDCESRPWPLCVQHCERPDARRPGPPTAPHSPAPPQPSTPSSLSQMQVSNSWISAIELYHPHPDVPVALCATYESSILLVDCRKQNPKRVHTLNQHGGSVRCLHFDKRCCCSLVLPTEVCVVFSSKLLFSSGFDMNIILWRLVGTQVPHTAQPPSARQCQSRQHSSEENSLEEQQRVQSVIAQTEGSTSQTVCSSA